MNKLPWILLLIPLTFITTDAVYNRAQIANIVTGHAMQFRNFPRRGDRQYAVLMILPGSDNNFAFNPNRQSLTNVNADVLRGTNYAVARTRFGRHTERLLLAQLPTLLTNYRQAHDGDNPPAVLLYTRGTPCYDCSGAIVQTRRNTFAQGQFIVAYSANMQSGGMTPTTNCMHRNYLRRNGIEVYCVWEPRANQCWQDDDRPCRLHNRLYG